MKVNLSPSRSFLPRMVHTSPLTCTWLSRISCFASPPVDTRLANFSEGEVSEYYEDKIIPTDVALAHLGIVTPDEIEYDGRTYVKGVNGYIVKGMEHLNDVKRGLYMLSIPSNFIFKINGTEFAHVYKERNAKGTAAPELKTGVESMADQVEEATNGFMNRDLLMAIKN